MTAFDAKMRNKPFFLLNFSDFGFSVLIFVLLKGIGKSQNFTKIYLLENQCTCLLTTNIQKTAFKHRQTYTFDLSQWQTCSILYTLQKNKLISFKYERNMNKFQQHLNRFNYRQIHFPKNLLVCTENCPMGRLVVITLVTTRDHIRGIFCHFLLQL